MKIKFIFFFLLSILPSCSKQKTADPNNESIEISPLSKSWSISSIDKWLLNKGLINVESIAYDEANQVFYATNGIDYELGTSGFISRISNTGKLKELKWLSDLNRPTGMAIYDSLLYVADVNSLLVINTKNGRIVDKYLEPISNSGLNDVAVNRQGEVFVSGSFVHSVFKLKNGELTLWSRDEENLKWANGMIATDKNLVVAGLNLNIIDLESRKISRLDLSDTLEDFDGIVPDEEGGYFLTTVGNSGLYHVNKKMIITKLLEEDIYFGDLEFNPKSRIIYIPRGNKKTNEFFISVLKLKYR